MSGRLRERGNPVKKGLFLAEVDVSVSIWSLTALLVYWKLALVRIDGQTRLWENLKDVCVAAVRGEADISEWTVLILVPFLMLALACAIGWLASAVLCSVAHCVGARRRQKLLKVRIHAGRRKRWAEALAVGTLVTGEAWLIVWSRSSLGECLRLARSIWTVLLLMTAIASSVACLLKLTFRARPDDIPRLTKGENDALH
jgi:hypothetical protein